MNITKSSDMYVLWHGRGGNEMLSGSPYSAVISWYEETESSAGPPSTIDPIPDQRISVERNDRRKLKYPEKVLS
jgi:hypothetical protein